MPFTTAIQHGNRQYRARTNEISMYISILLHKWQKIEHLASLRNGSLVRAMKVRDGSIDAKLLLGLAQQPHLVRFFGLCKDGVDQLM